MLADDYGSEGGKNACRSRDKKKKYVESKGIVEEGIKRTYEGDACQRRYMGVWKKRNRTMQ